MDNKASEDDRKNATRSRSAAALRAATRHVGEARGVLRRAGETGQFHHARIAPCVDLLDIVQHFWIVRWDLRNDDAQMRATLPHPHAHLVIRQGVALVHGIHTGRFETRLEGSGGAFGVKFRPGGLRALIDQPLSRLRNRSVPASKLFGSIGATLAAIDPQHPDDTRNVAIAEASLLAGAKAVCEAGLLAARIVEDIALDRGVLAVEQLTLRWGLGARSLQRLFHEQVGIGPKWVINRYRIHEVIDRLAQGERPDWSRLALELGYFDQSHFIRDFKRLVGCTPADYVGQTFSSASSTVVAGTN